MTLGRLSRGTAPLAAFLLAGATAHGETPSKAACLQASDRAQQQRLAGQFVASRDALHICIQDACPKVVRDSCSQWLGEVTASLPSIVVVAKDSAGRDLVDVKVSIDGKQALDRLGGLALAIDPGRHRMRYENPDGLAVDDEILVAEGVKDRVVSVVFAAKGGSVGVATPVVPPPASTVSDGASGASTTNTVVGTILAAVGAAALGTALYLDVATTIDANALHADPCARTGTCSASRVSSDQLDYDLAGVGLGVGLVAAGFATYVLLARPLGASPGPGARGTARQPPAFRVVPAASGGGFAIAF